MASWVEDDARINAILFRDGPELWRDLKSSLHQAVKDYTRIYSPQDVVEVQYTDCTPVSEECIRVRATPPGKPDISVEIRFSLENQQIQCSGNAGFTMAVESGEVVIKNKDGMKVTIEDASRTILKPLFDNLPRRRPNIAT
jgi:hypothetical protein